MDNLPNPIRTVKKVQSSIDKFETLSLNDSSHSAASKRKTKRSLLDITSSSTNDAVSGPLDLRPSQASSKSSLSSQPANKKHRRHDSTAFLQKSYLDTTKAAPASLPDDAREILKSQPEFEDLYAVLQYLQYGIDGQHDFNVRSTGPKQSQIINTLVTVTVLHQWHVLRKPEISKQEARLKTLLVSCLMSVAGIGALLLQIRTSTSIKSQTHSFALGDSLSLLQELLQSPRTLLEFLSYSLSLETNDSQRHLLWQEVVSLLAGSKILSTVSQAIATTSHDNNEEAAWLGDGTKYCTWLARNASMAMTNQPGLNPEAWTMLSQVVKRTLSLGYREAFVSELYSSLLLGSRALWTPLHQLLEHLSTYDQKVFFDTMLRDLVRKYLRTGPFMALEHSNGLESEEAIGGVAAMIVGMTQSNSNLEDHVVHWLTTTNGDYSGLGLDTRRAVIATLALRQDKLQLILEKCLSNFGDKLQTQHSPILQQEARAQIILLTAGYLNRLSHESLARTSKSSVFLQSVSNRLAASLPRARLLGMFVGVAMSRLADGPSKAMSFDVDELESEDAQRWLNLTSIDDKIGSLSALQRQSPDPQRSAGTDAQNPTTQSKIRRKKKTPPAQSSKIISIEEIADDKVEDDEAKEEEEDLRPYQKPDDDPSDSEDDPTLIDRTRPSAPVYITDLIRLLQTNDKPDIIELALKTAAPLIRRKATFGTELSDNIHALASALVNLPDGPSANEIQQLRSDALIACAVSMPAVVGPWAATIYFEGDFNLAQRASVLTMIGLGSRELAGYKDTPAAESSSPSVFPSQRLPGHLAAAYAPLNSVALEIERSTLQPMALAAADKVSGPDILKVRTFSSRLEVQKKTALKAKERSQRIPKQLHQILTESFYLPLCCRMSLLFNSRVNISRSNVFEPHLMRLFLQTLTIILAALGPHALKLASVTHETLILLNALHQISKLSHDPVVLPAMLQLLLTTLDLNIEAGPTAEERLVTEFGTVMAELIVWAGSLSSVVSVPVGSGDSMEEGSSMPWTVLVAGIQVKWHDVGKKFQGRMLGLMGGDLGDF